MLIPIMLASDMSITTFAIEKRKSLIVVKSLTNGYHQKRRLMKNFLLEYPIKRCTGLESIMKKCFLLLHGQFWDGFQMFDMHTIRPDICIALRMIALQEMWRKGQEFLDGSNHPDRVL